MTKKQLSKRIRVFLKTYTKKVNDEYTSPDAYQLETCADMLDNNIDIQRLPWSEWGSGGYLPYSSKEGSKEHDFLLNEISKIIK
jgi:hypothetical protein